ncbi:MAG: response regulator [Caldilineaceae bacterium]
MTLRFPVTFQWTYTQISRFVIKSISRLLAPPQVEDPTQARIAVQLCYLLVLGIPIAFTVLFLDEEVRSGIWGWRDLIAGAVGVMLIVLFILLSRGYIKLPSYLLVIICLGAITVGSFHNGGIRNPMMTAVPVMLMVSSILLGIRPTLIFTVLMSVVATFFYLCEQSGINYALPATVDARQWLIVLIQFGLTTAVLYLTINQTIQSEQRVRQQADKLHSQNEQLAQIQAVLEARTYELSKLNADLQLEMTERARTEAALRQKQKLESVGLLVGGIAHDFNNLLTCILNQSDLALRRIDRTEKAQRHLEKALQSTQRAAELTQQLLTYAGKARLQVEPVDLNQMIQENSALLDTVLQRNFRLHLNLSPELPAVLSDRGQLQQILMNLVINAAESINHKQGEIVIHTASVIITDKVAQTSFVGSPPAPGNYVYLEVCDNGVGIEPDALEKIFDPYFSTKERGSGLGLSAVLGVVRSLQGRMQVESTPHIGTVFRVYLPASPLEAVRADSAKLQEVGTFPTAAQLSSELLVLVIDDDDMVREASMDLLGSLGYSTLSASNGQVGLAIFEQHQNRIDMILLDLVMPVMDGIETVQRLRTMNQNVPIILCSGYTNKGIPDNILQHPVTGRLDKPYSREQLVNLMVKMRAQASSLQI